MKNINKLKLVVAGLSLCFFVSCTKDEILENKEVAADVTEKSEGLNPDAIVSYQGKQMKYSECEKISTELLKSFKANNSSSKFAVQSEWAALRSDFINNSLGWNRGDVINFGQQAGQDPIAGSAVNNDFANKVPAQVAFDTNNANKYLSNTLPGALKFFTIWDNNSNNKPEYQFKGEGGASTYDRKTRLFLNFSSQKVYNPYPNKVYFVPEISSWKSIAIASSDTYTVTGGVSVTAGLSVGIPANAFSASVTLDLSVSRATTIGVTYTENYSRDAVVIPIGQYVIFTPTLNFRPLISKYTLPLNVKGYICLSNNNFINRSAYGVELSNNHKAIDFLNGLRPVQKTISITQEVDPIYSCRIQFYNARTNILVRTIGG